MTAPRNDPDLRTSLRYLLGFTALLLLAHELHELAHTAAGRAICGAWGPRDFNSWSLAPGCTALLPTLVGPLFTYLLIWCSGLPALRRHRGWGLALVLAPNPFARLFTAALGGGDEGVLVRAWTEWDRGLLATTITLALVACLTLYPLWRAWRMVPAPGRAGRFVLLLVWPMVVTGILLFLVGNRLLTLGVGTAPVFAGAPLLIWIVTAIAAGGCYALRRSFDIDS